MRISLASRGEKDVEKEWNYIESLGRTIAPHHREFTLNYCAAKLFFVFRSRRKATKAKNRVQ